MLKALRDIRIRPKINWDEPKDFESELSKELDAFTIDDDHVENVERTIDKSLRSTRSGLEIMRATQKRIEEQIDLLQDELAQTKVVIRALDAAEGIMAPHALIPSPDSDNG